MPLILMYHSISPYEEDPYGVTVTPQRFEQQMRWLSRRELRGTSVRELLDARAEGRSRTLVGLTVDDGYEDFLTYALPILDRYRFTATVFALAGRLDGTNTWDAAGPCKPLLMPNQLRQVAAAGIEIGSHGYTHMRLSLASDQQLDQELVRSRAILQEITGQEVDGFCYPYGSLTKRVVDAVQSAGYDYGCGSWYSAQTDRHALTAKGLFRLLRPTPVETSAAPNTTISDRVHP